VRGGGRRAAGGDDFQLDAAFVPAVHIHFGRFANHNKIRFDAGVYLHEGVGRDAVAPFFHVAKVVNGVPVEKAEVTGDCQAINHPRRASFFIAGAAGVKVAVFHLADEGVPFPVANIAHADCVDVRVVHQDPRTAANPADGIAHFVEAHFFIAELSHLSLNALAHRANQRIRRRDGADVAQKLDDVVSILFYSGFDFLHKTHEVSRSLRCNGSEFRFIHSKNRFSVRARAAGQNVRRPQEL